MLITLLPPQRSLTSSNIPVCNILSCDGQWRPLVLPDRYIDHGSPADQLAEAGLSASHIAATVLNVLGKTREALEIMTIS